MTTHALITILLAGVSCLVLGMVSIQFFRGKWLILLVGTAAKTPESNQSAKPLGRHLSYALLMGCLLMGSLAVYKSALIFHNTTLTTGASLVNNGSFIAFVVMMIWFFIVCRPRARTTTSSSYTSPPHTPRRQSLDYLPATTLIFVLILIVLIGSVGFLAGS